ncbi:MAG TPA: zinc-dependent alcohol dehydrogenase [Kofleriaceae bacterium]|nr:zinc-dependent alcohol dehydrogenase [Kofleriaceae bacterium]
MKAIVFHDIGDIRLDDVDEPSIEQPTDAIVRLTATAICGTDLHMVRGTMPGMKEGTILGHEGVGVVEELGPGVRDLEVGDRVIIPSTIACGYCSYCRAGYHAQCDVANPNGSQAGTAFFGGPAATGPFHGLQAEYARVPFANVGLVRIPDEVPDDAAILLSDIAPTGWFGADMAHIHPGHTVAVFGCGPVGIFAIASAQMRRAGRILAVDHKPDRLQMARRAGAETIDFSREDPVAVIRELTGGIGVDRVIDAVGVDAERPHGGPAARDEDQERFDRMVAEVAPQAHPQNGSWQPGDAPTQSLEWAIQAVAKAGTIAIIGLYPQNVRAFPLGQAMMRNLSIRAGNCHHRRYIPELLERVRSGAFDPRHVLTQVEPLTSAIDAYRAFDRREQGWLKVELTPPEPPPLAAA